MDETRAGNVQSMITRPVDFYGPNAKQNYPYVTIIQRLKAGQSSQRLGKPNLVHTFISTPDAGKALALFTLRDQAVRAPRHYPQPPERRKENRPSQTPDEFL